MIKRLIRSFAYAFHGIKIALKERNFRIQLIVFIAVIIAGFYYQLNIIEWLAIIIVGGLVLGFEVMNTAIEELCDKLSKKRDKDIKRIKDLSAAAVLLISIVSLGIGILIFLPKII